MKKGNCPDEGFVNQIILPNGKFIFLGIISPAMEKIKNLGWENKMVQYISDDCHADLNRAIHQGKMIRINGILATDFIHQIANLEEFEQIIKELN
jgi:hypothetical protein